MNDDLAARTLAGLRHTAPYCDLQLTNQPVSDLQKVLNTLHLALRLPLYHRRLDKPAPPERAYDAAEQQGLAFLAAFASAAGVRQAILRADGRIVVLSASSHVRETSTGPPNMQSRRLSSSSIVRSRLPICCILLPRWRMYHYAASGFMRQPAPARSSSSVRLKTRHPRGLFSKMSAAQLCTLHICDEITGPVTHAGPVFPTHNVG